MVYGPGDPLRRFYPVVKRIQDGRRVVLFSDRMAAWRGTKGYVEDVARAIALAATDPPPPGCIYNVGESDTLTELEWAERIADAMDWDGAFVLRADEDLPAFLRAPGNTAQHWVADTSRIRTELGFRESIDRTEAIRRTVGWERQAPSDQWHPHEFDYAAEDAAARI